MIAESNRLLATAEVADTPQSRMTGLLGRDGLPPGQGLILEPCRLIHTFMMRFAIDVVFYDRAHRVTRAVARCPAVTLRLGRVARAGDARTAGGHARRGRIHAGAGDAAQAGALLRFSVLRRLPIM